MPNNQDVLDALRIPKRFSSLRFLSYMLYTMTRTVQPEEGVTEAEMTSINHLVAEVRSQKAKITELGRSFRNASCKVSPTPSGPTSSSTCNDMGLESWEIADVEAAETEVPVHGVRQNWGTILSNLPPQQLRATPGLPAFHSAANWKCRDEQSSSSSSTDQQQSSSCPDSRHTGGMGRQISDMGKEACRTHIPRSGGCIKWILARISIPSTTTCAISRTMP